jgi:hypothetical protein
MHYFAVFAWAVEARESVRSIIRVGSLPQLKRIPTTQRTRSYSVIRQQVQVRSHGHTGPTTRVPQGFKLSAMGRLGRAALHVYFFPPIAHGNLQRQQGLFSTVMKTRWLAGLHLLPTWASLSASVQEPLRADISSYARIIGAVTSTWSKHCRLLCTSGRRSLGRQGLAVLSFRGGRCRWCHRNGVPRALGGVDIQHPK